MRMGLGIRNATPHMMAHCARDSRRNFLVFAHGILDETLRLIARHGGKIAKEGIHFETC